MTADAVLPDLPPIRAVLDTSVLFCAHRHWLWLLARLGYYEAVWSAFIVGELVRIRVEHSTGKGVDRVVYRQRVNDLIHALSDALSIVNYRSVNAAGSLRDPDDDPIVTPVAFLAELEDHFPAARLTIQAEDAGRRLP